MHSRRRAWLSLQRALTPGGWPARAAYLLGGQRGLELRTEHVHFTSDTPLPPLRLVFASDFHAGPSTHPSHLARVCKTLNALEPDLLLLGGDFACLSARDTDALAEGLGTVRARLGTFAVLGNHDLWAGADIVRGQLEQSGVQVLVNARIPLPHPYGDVSVIGLDDPIEGSPDADRAFEGAGQHRILLMHAPGGLLSVGDRPFSLALAGHTHGGQIALPGGTPVVVPSGALSRRYAYGRFAIGQGRTLLVSRGVGYSTIPLRIFCPPEAIVCELSFGPPSGQSVRVQADGQSGAPAFARQAGGS